MKADSDIAKWYQGKSVFITGATGFMGKVLVEKLLRSCPDIGLIYVLIRKKKEMLLWNRAHEIMTSGVFDKVRAMRKDRKDCLFPIAGDVGLPELGISHEDRRLLRETVSVVFHLAATVRFDESLKDAVAIHIGGTRALLELCRGMTNLCAIVHVSTAYSNCTHPVIEERVYPPPVDPSIVENCVGGLNDDLLELVTPRLIGNHPNTYTFTKALTEYMVAKYSTELPIVVVRPSIVTASWKEPNPGWIDTFSGSTGLVAGAGSGLVKSIYGKGQLVADLIPVDVCINLFIAAAWEIGIRESAKLVPNVCVYNCVSRPFKSLSWDEFVRTIDSCTTKYAMSDVFMTPNIRMTDSRAKHAFDTILGQTVPAILADICIRLWGGTPKFQRYQCKLNKLARLLEFFTTHEFEFSADNVDKLKRRLNPVDRVIFNFDVTEIDWEEYLTRYFLGIRKHLMNEKDDTIRSSRQRVIRLTMIKKAIQIGILFLIAISFLKIYLASVF